jgi:hypothetical protein
MFVNSVIKKEGLGEDFLFQFFRTLKTLSLNSLIVGLQYV